MVNIKIEGVSYQVEEGLTILEAAKKCGYEIPSLCAFNHGECANGSCHVCLVEVKGTRGLVASCVYPVNEGMEVIISSPKAAEARRASVELLLSNHNINVNSATRTASASFCTLPASPAPGKASIRAPRPLLRWTSCLPPSSGIPPSASSAAVVWPGARTPTAWVFWALRTVVSTPSWPLLRTAPS